MVQRHDTTKPLTLSERRLIENEALVRQVNEKVQQAVERAFEPKEQSNMSLHFYCECADIKCQARITLSPVEYKKVHRNRRRFVVEPGHVVLTVEREIEHHPHYAVIEKLPFGRVRHLLNARRKPTKTNEPLG